MDSVIGFLGLPLDHICVFVRRTVLIAAVGLCPLAVLSPDRQREEFMTYFTDAAPFLAQIELSTQTASFFIFIPQ